MACAELLAVRLLSADRGPAPRRQPLPIFHDVNDGKLSFEEFKNYFADGILSSEELWELFSGIDRRHSDSAESSKWCLCLCSVSHDLFEFSSGEVHPQQRLPILSPSLQRYETSSKMEQFLTRFLLRETMHQLQSLQASLECAVDTVEEQAGRERKDIKKPEISVGLRSGRRCGRRAQKNICLSPTDPYSGMLTTGICSLAIPWVGVSTPLEPGVGVGAAARDSGGWTVSPRCQLELLWDVVSLEQWEKFQEKNKSAPSQGRSCPHSVSACKLTDEACFILYEFWQDVTSWRSHLQSSCSKTFQRSIISLLESPELLTTMLFPGEGGVLRSC
ncbi:NECA1 protein, partial [Herpetotheres cachinnans]|nr:NECA1 protein [Herpetotheres cachinnans]